MGRFFRFVAASALLTLITAQAYATEIINATPRIHRHGEEAYFVVEIKLPADAPKTPLFLSTRVEKGDAYLVYASLPFEENKEKVITVTGRYGRPGPATISVLSRPAKDLSAQLKPLVTVNIELPGDDSDAPGVDMTWATQMQRRIRLAGYGSSDSFINYWNSIAARKYGISESYVSPFSRRGNQPPDLYSIFTGAAAIQESLQLEVLRGMGIQSKSDGLVSLDSLSGPAVKSHPFKEMLKGNKPKVSPLSRFIPSDQYAVFFSDINKEIEFSDLMDEWGGSLLHQISAESQDFHVKDKLTKQLCLDPGLLTRLFGDRVIGQLAFTGNDPFVKEGTDFTALFLLKNKEVFRSQLEKRYDDAVKNFGAKDTSLSLNGRSIISVATPDHRISSFALFMDDVAVVSNSQESIRRIADTVAGKVDSLSDALDYQYMRTLFPEGDNSEDIFVYLSDAHIRKLVSPRWKIAEARRVICDTDLQILANARLWFRMEHRREPTMKELTAGGYLGQGITCPDGGAYSLGHGEPVCSVHNRTGHLTSIGSMALEKVTKSEAERYKAFVENYNRYWTRFFDPIGIRIKLGDNIHVQTCILPLIENSWYDGLAAFSGKEPGILTESSVLPRSIFSLRGRFSKEWLNKTDFIASRSRLIEWLGDELSLNMCDGHVLFTIDGMASGLFGSEMGRSAMPLVAGYLASAVNLPTYLAVKVKDAAEAEKQIPILFRSLIQEDRSEGPSIETYNLESYKGKSIFAVNFKIFFIKMRLYTSVVNDQLILATRRDIVTDLIDNVSGANKTSIGNLEFSIYRKAFREIESDVNLSYQEDLRHACQKNLALADILLGIADEPEKSLGSTALKVRGYDPYCPSGGKYVIDPSTNRVACTVHGTASRPKQPDANDKSSPMLQLVNSLARVNARLSFVPEGLMATLDIERKKK